MNTTTTNWKTIDWSKRTTDIALEEGVNINIVSRKRKQLSPETLQHRNTIYSWGEVNWSESNEEIASKLGCSRDHVSVRRSESKARFSQSQISRRIDWQHLNWMRTNKKIYLETNTTLSTIMLKRKEFAPETEKMFSNKLKWENVNWNRHSIEIAKEMGVNITQVSRKRRKVAPHTLGMKSLSRAGKPHKHNWDNIDWSKRDAIIAKELGNMSLGGVKTARKRHSKRFPVNPPERIEYGVDSNGKEITAGDMITFNYQGKKKIRRVVSAFGKIKVVVCYNPRLESSINNLSSIVGAFYLNECKKTITKSLFQKIRGKVKQLHTK